MFIRNVISRQSGREIPRYLFPGSLSEDPIESRSESLCLDHIGRWLPGEEFQRGGQRTQTCVADNLLQVVSSGALAKGYDDANFLNQIFLVLSLGHSAPVAGSRVLVERYDGILLLLGACNRGVRK